jgi:hypothetical protein
LIWRIFILGGEKYSGFSLISEKSYQIFFRHVIRYTAFLETQLNPGMRDIGDIRDKFVFIKLDQRESGMGNFKSEVDFNQLILLKI